MFKALINQEFRIAEFIEKKCDMVNHIFPNRFTSIRQGHTKRRGSIQTRYKYLILHVLFENLAVLELIVFSIVLKLKQMKQK